MTPFVVGLKRSRPVRQFKKTSVGRLAVSLAAAYRQSQAAARGSAASTTPASARRHRNRPVVSAARRFRVEEYLAKCRTLPIEDTVVLYESFDGNGMLDSPLSIFCELLQDPDFAELKHVWVIADAKVYAESMAEYAGHRRVSFVTYKSKEYYDRLSTAKFLINNTSFPREFAKRPGQVYVNTWHGIPLKRMGYDVPDGATGARNILRNLVAADYLVSANAYMTDVMYKQAFKLDGIYRGTVIQAGYPRIDGQFLNEHGQARVREELRAKGVAVDEREIILYAPTWRGDSFQDPDFDLENLVRLVEEVTRRIDTNRHQVLVKVHQFVYRRATFDWRLQGLLVPNDVPVNSLLGVTDVLVTDYSSLFYDFLAQDKPVVFYTPDLDDYDEGRGFYAPPSTWPGPVVRTVEDLAEELATLAACSSPAVLARRARWTSEHTGQEDGSSTRRVVDVIFRGLRGDVAIHDGLVSPEKTRVLLYAGGLFRNGITSSLLALLNHIDYSRYDVSIFYNYSSDEVRLGYARQVHPAVRHFPRVGAMIQSYKDKLDRHALEDQGFFARGVDKKRQLADYRTEWERCFGDLEFDHVIDFSGYSPFWSLLLLQGNAPTTSIWVHNDMKREVAKVTGGKRTHERALPSVFTLYHLFDNVVSASEDLNRITVRDLGRFAKADTFTYASNVVDFAGIQEKAYGPSALGASAVVEPSDGSVDFGHGVGGQLARLAHIYGWQTVEQEIGRHKLRDLYMPSPPGMVNFVSIGRLSPEKNHERLIRAFAKVHADDPMTRLVIFGEGALRPHLEGLIRRLELESVVVLAGHHDNPMPAVAAADCFVFSSDYEGQGLVVLEAMSLGIPVVTCEFEVVWSVVSADRALVVDQTVEALADGMAEFRRGNVPKPLLDTDEYNRNAIAEFERVVGPADAAEPA